MQTAGVRVRQRKHSALKLRAHPSSSVTCGFSTRARTASKWPLRLAVLHTMSCSMLDTCAAAPQSCTPGPHLAPGVAARRPAARRAPRACISSRASTTRDSSDMSVTCLPALRCAALNSLKFSTKFCMSSMVATFLVVAVWLWNASTSSFTAVPMSPKLAYMWRW